MFIKNLLRKSTPFVVGIACALIITGWLPRLKTWSNTETQINQVYSNVIKQNSFSHIVTPVLQSVVSIYSTATIQESKYPSLGDPLFKEKFKKTNELTTRKKSNLGSGIILNEQGYILTNHHIIKDADQITILLADGRETHATLIGVDGETDLAVLKIQLSGLQAISIEQNPQPNVGDIVFTIGNPYGVGQSVSMGILSATGRNQIGLTSIENYLQTDAAINPGSSGGALINAHGNLIGLNTAIISNSGGSQGIGFAIPNSIAINTAIQIIEHGKVTRGYLGIHDSRILSVQEAQEKGIDFYAFLITKLTTNGPAQQAGIKEGDILVQIAGDPILNPNNIGEKIANLAPGTKLDIQILRDTSFYNLTITLASRELIKFDQ